MISNGNPVFYDKYIKPSSLQQLWHTDITDLFDECISTMTFTAEVSFALDAASTKPILYWGGSDYSNGMSIGTYAYNDGNAQGPRTGVRGFIGSKNAVPFGRKLLSGTSSISSTQGAFTVKLISNETTVIASQTAIGTIPYTSKRFAIGYRYNYTSVQPLTDGITKVYCIRIYNRELSNDELLHNAAIDKIRFNLE